MHVGESRSVGPSVGWVRNLERDPYFLTPTTIQIIFRSEKSNRYNGLLRTKSHQFLCDLSLGKSHRGSRSRADASRHHRDTTSSTIFAYRIQAEPSSVPPHSSPCAFRSVGVEAFPTVVPCRPRLSPGLTIDRPLSVANASVWLSSACVSEPARRRHSKFLVAALQKSCSAWVEGSARSLEDSLSDSCKHR